MAAACDQAKCQKPMGLFLYRPLPKTSLIPTHLVCSGVAGSTGSRSSLLKDPELGSNKEGKRGEAQKRGFVVKSSLGKSR